MNFAPHNPFDPYLAIYKIAEEEKEPEPKKKEPFRLNRATMTAGLKMVGAGALGAGLGSAAYKGVGHLFDTQKTLQDLPHHRLLQLGAGVGTALPATYAVLKGLNHEYLRDAHDRSQERAPEHDHR